VRFRRITTEPNQVTVTLPEPEHVINGKTFFPGCVVAHGTAFVQVSGQTMNDPDALEAKAASMLAAAKLLRES
jgi:hypothetical protein